MQERSRPDAAVHARRGRHRGDLAFRTGASGCVRAGFRGGRVTKARLLFLPDFVGYPICYFDLEKKLAGTVDAHLIDYNAFWPYDSVDELAAAIVESVVGEHYHAVAGYSFGAHVAVRVANVLYARGTVSHLHLIDPPVLAEVGAIAHDVEAQLKRDARYRYVFDLAECELTDLDLVFRNVRLLDELPKRYPATLPCSLYVAGDDQRYIACADQFVGDGVPITQFAIAGTNHREILQCASLARALATTRDAETARQARPGLTRAPEHTTVGADRDAKAAF
ncbi:hypothetical protein DM992_25440 [Burkholderia sp. JP2-270]|nr:hypothetical protein DM992_25440 [Burkholderia sp. JP2-270]